MTIQYRSISKRNEKCDPDWRSSPLIFAQISWNILCSGPRKKLLVDPWTRDIYAVLDERKIKRVKSRKDISTGHKPLFFLLFKLQTPITNPYIYIYMPIMLVYHRIDASNVFREIKNSRPCNVSNSNIIYLFSSFFFFTKMRHFDCFELCEKRIINHAHRSSSRNHSVFQYTYICTYIYIGKSSSVFTPVRHMILQRLPDVCVTRAC